MSKKKKKNFSISKNWIQQNQKYKRPKFKWEGPNTSSSQSYIQQSQIFEFIKWVYNGIEILSFPIHKSKQAFKFNKWQWKNFQKKKNPYRYAYVSKQKGRLPYLVVMAATDKERRVEAAWGRCVRWRSVALIAPLA